MDNPKEKLSKQTNILKETFRILLSIIFSIMIALSIRTFIGERTYVIGHSMEATLNDADNLILDKISYHLHKPQRFDIVVFPYEQEENTNYIKRIIGLPGETIQIDKEGNIYINRKILEESYGKEKIDFAGIAQNPIQLGDQEYFVLGDNRNNSFDSRFSEVGPINQSDILGKAWIRIYPFKDFGPIQ